MIIYGSESVSQLEEFGVDFQLKNDRRAILQYLKKMLPPQMFSNDFVPLAREDLLLAHSREYVDALYSDKLSTFISKAFELSGQESLYDYSPEKKSPEEFLELIMRVSGGSYKCMFNAISYDFCYYLGGGLIYAHKDKAGDFSLINDVCVSIKKMVDKSLIKNAWIIDLSGKRPDGLIDIVNESTNLSFLGLYPNAHSQASSELSKGGTALRKGATFEIDLIPGHEGEYLGKIQEGISELKQKNRGLPDLVVVINGTLLFEKEEAVLNSDSPLSHSYHLSQNEIVAASFYVYEWLKKNLVAQAWVQGPSFSSEGHNVYVKLLEKIYATEGHKGQGQNPEAPSHNKNFSRQKHGGKGRSHHLGQRYKKQKNKHFHKHSNKKNTNQTT